MDASRPTRILVVDDERAIQEVMEELLTEFGYDVETASSGDEALRAVTDNAYDLVISDLRMPGFSGAALTNALVRCRPALANRIVLITGDVTAPVPHRL
jgi:CheY-like chemotaxis protein